MKLSAFLGGAPQGNSETHRIRRASGLHHRRNFGSSSNVTMARTCRNLLPWRFAGAGFNFGA
ncbi:hypothetical protein KCP73_04600 [Salmonella enterica subsp. enterica]|nr:hypothetical protein KCP73_04600 [Salmonella enterica subsp. enterica]